MHIDKLLIKANLNLSNKAKENKRHGKEVVITAALAD